MPWPLILEQLKKCFPEFSHDCSSNFYNNALTLNEEVCFYINEANSIQNVIYLKLSNSNNYFFEISKKKRVSSAKDVSNVIVFEDLDRYTRVHVQPEQQIHLATSLWQKMLKKKMDFFSLSGWKMCSDVVRWGWKRVFNAKAKTLKLVRNWMMSGEKVETGEDSGEDKSPSEAQSYDKQLKIINHIGDFELFKIRKFMFLNQNLLGTQLAIPPFSSLNIPNMIFVDFNSERINKEGQTHSFHIVKGLLDDEGNETKPPDHRNLSHRQIERFMDDMVLVLKNNQTQLSIIPIK